MRGACKAAKVSSRSHYEWLADPTYYAQFEEAERKSVKTLEDEARRRAFEGCRRLKFDARGKPLIDPATKKPYEELQYSDTLLIFLLKGALPEKYRERMEANHTGTVKHEGAVEHRVLFTELLAQQDYVEFLRHRTSVEDCDAGAICQTREPGNGKPLANGQAYGGAGPGTNCHRNGHE